MPQPLRGWSMLQIRSGRIVESRAPVFVRMPNAFPSVQHWLMAHRSDQEKDDVLTCLVTGNLEPIGWGKMRALGLLPLFSEPRFGGFGSDHCSGNTLESWRDREELVRIAAARARSSADGAARCGSC